MRKKKIIIGVYVITNMLNGSMYIGQSRDIIRRWRDEKLARDDFALSRALRKYGISNFSFEILIECPLESLDFFEKAFIDAYGTFSGRKHYNLTSGGNSNKIISEETRETRLRNKEARKERRYLELDDVPIRKTAKPGKYKKPRADDSIKKMEKEIKKGKKAEERNRKKEEKIELKNKRENEKSEKKNKRESEKSERVKAEAGPKVSKRHGPMSEEHKRKIGQANTGKVPVIKGGHHSEETKRKIGLANAGRGPVAKGQHLSEEHKRNIGEANKKRSELKRLAKKQAEDLLASETPE